MNLHQVVAGAVGAINPQVLGTVQHSTGYETAADGSRTSTYATYPNVLMQVQALAADELKQVDGLNIQGQKKGIYLNGNWSGLVRQTGGGGDIITLPDSSTWLVVLVLENWPDWTKVAVVRQT